MRQKIYWNGKDDLDFYVLGRLESRNAKSIIANDNLNLNNSRGGLEGQFGHQLIEENIVIEEDIAL